MQRVVRFENAGHLVRGRLLTPFILNGRFLASRSRANLHHAATAIGVFTTNFHVDEVAPECFALFDQLGQFVGRQFFLLWIGAERHLPDLIDLFHDVVEAAEFGGDFGQRSPLAGDRRDFGRIAENGRIHQLLFEKLESSKLLFQLFSHRSALNDVDWLGIGRVHSRHLTEDL